MNCGFGPLSPIIWTYNS